MTVPKDKVKLTLQWFGLKRLNAPQGHFLLPKADLYLDCRVIAEKGIRGAGGLDPVFQAGVMAQCAPVIQSMVNTITGSLELISARRSTKDPYEEPFVVCFFCAWGISRSPATCILVAGRLKKLGYNVIIVGHPLRPHVSSPAAERVEAVQQGSDA